MSLSDTVGFINRLLTAWSDQGRSSGRPCGPSGVHVVDDAPDPAQIDAVRVVLDEIDAAVLLQLLVFSKAMAKELVIGGDQRGDR